MNGFQSKNNKNYKNKTHPNESVNKPNLSAGHSLRPLLLIFPQYLPMCVTRKIKFKRVNGNVSLLFAITNIINYVNLRTQES